VRAILLAAAAALLGGAAPSETASLFRDGRFAEAAEVGVEEGTAASLLLAARALLADAAYRTADKARALALCERAGRIADAALARDPRSAAALLQKGIALGYAAKLQRSPGLAKQARKLVDAARAADPDDALAWAALGGWHGESVATLGGFVAGTVLGARRSEAVRAFETALAKDKGGSVVPAFYAFTLLALGADDAPRARRLLAAAVQATPRDGFETLLRRQAAQVLPLLERGDVAGARTMAKRLQPFGTIG
jgi:hypothetical protein